MPSRKYTPLRNKIEGIDNNFSEVSPAEDNELKFARPNILTEAIEPNKVMVDAYSSGEPDSARPSAPIETFADPPEA